MVAVKQQAAEPEAAEEPLDVRVTPSSRGVRCRIEVWDKDTHLGGHDSFDLIKDKHWQALQNSVEDGVRRQQGGMSNQERLNGWFDQNIRRRVDEGIAAARKKREENHGSDDDRQSDLAVVVTDIEASHLIDLWCDPKNDVRGYFTSIPDNKEPA